MPGCRRYHLRLNAPVQELKDNFKRYIKSPVVHVVFPAQHAPTLPWRSV